ncbi:MAG: amidohydrolase family protein [Bacteroidales bacterium]|nr:amidohydrolase family protein [Bacteroidales bacterium]
MLKLIKNARFYDAPKGDVNDILIAGNKIAAIDKNISAPAGIPCEVVDAKGKLVTPGLIDIHVHTSGGGGQTGFLSLAPEVKASSLIACGTTTVVGLLGTDGFVKQLRQLYAKTMSLRENNLSAYMLTGYYGLPTPTLTECVADDLIFIAPVIGCKIAIADDRSSFPTELDLLRLINKVRLGGFTSSKGGVIHVHLGSLPEGMTLLLDIAKQYPSLIQHISPTHTMRTEPLFNQAIEFSKMGGMMDITTGGSKFMEPYESVFYALERGASIDSITFSSDGNGGITRVDPVTGESSYSLAPVHGNLDETIKLITKKGMSEADAFKLVTANPAKVMHFKTKGHIKVGFDADFCIFDSDYKITDVISLGNSMLRDGEFVMTRNYE